MEGEHKVIHILNSIGQLEDYLSAVHPKMASLRSVRVLVDSADTDTLHGLVLAMSKPAKWPTPKVFLRRLAHVIDLAAYIKSVNTDSVFRHIRSGASAAETLSMLAIAFGNVRLTNSAETRARWVAPITFRPLGFC